jgi:hypothetical protein
MQKILVTMTRHNPINDVMHCLELLARPGMTVMFLFPYPVEGLSYFCDHWVTTESARAAMATGRSLLDRYSREAQTRFAWELVAPAAAALQRKQVQVEIHLDSRSLRKVVRDYGTDENIHWIVTEIPRGGWVSFLLAKTMLPLGWTGHLLSERVESSFREQALRLDKVYSARRS